MAGLCVALAESASTLVYPPPPRTNQVDNYHGRQIADPYRTLESPDNPATRAWIEAEVKLTNDWLAAIPQRDSIKRRLTQLYDYERYPAAALTNFSRGFIWSYAGAFSAGNHRFLLRNSGLQNQAVLYTLDAEGNQPKVLLDPNTFRKDGTAALCGLAPSRDGGLLAFGTAQAGSDWCEWRIRNVESGQDLPEVLQWTKDAAPAWTADSRAFYYVRYPKPPEGQLLTAVNRNPQVMLHRVGEAAERDQFVYEDPAHADSGLGPVLTADGRWLIVHMDLPKDSSRNMLYVEDLSAADDPIPDSDAIADAEQSANEVRGRIEGLGAVNAAAMEEYQEAQQRHDFLSAQRQDLIDSIRDTEKAIQEIDLVSRQKFSEAFEAINAHFRVGFQTLFGGGTGEMRLTDQENLADSGIDIVCSPPGKRLQNVLLLSGGEKALAAVALLMAIFRYQPSPFCVMDEVDAPLDEANIGRLANLIKEMSRETQFVVITHSKRTMEAAEALYGVTMQEPGVSRLVAVRFGPAEAAA